MGRDMGKVGMILEIKAWVVIIRGRGKSLEIKTLDKQEFFPHRGLQGRKFWSRLQGKMC